MANTTYKPFVDRMIGKYEGGYGWNRKDSGGPTKFGITCWDLAEHMGQKMDSMARWAPIVQAMTLETAEVIYAKKYAAAIHYDELPAGPDAEMLDYGVNSGISRPIRVARAILGVPGGGIMDGALLKAIQKCDPNKFIDDISAERLHFMHAIRGGSAWAEFGGGWGARVADLKSYSHHIAAGSTGTAPTAPDLSKIETPKARHDNPNTVKNVIKTTTGTVASAGTAGHFSGVPQELLAIGLGFIIVGGVAYALYQKQRASALNMQVILPPAVLPAVPLAA